MKKFDSHSYEKLISAENLSQALTASTLPSLNLVPAIREVESQINQLEAEFKAKVKPYYDSLNALRKINTACEKCGGYGKVLRSRACAEDDRPDSDDPRDWNTCPVCNGSGMTKHESEHK